MGEVAAASTTTTETMSGESTTATSSSKANSAKRKLDERAADLLGFDKESLIKLLKTVCQQRNDESRRYERHIKELEKKLKRQEREYIRKINLHLELSEDKAAHENERIVVLEAQAAKSDARIQTLEEDLDKMRAACGRAAEHIRRSESAAAEWCRKGEDLEDQNRNLCDTIIQNEQLMQHLTERLEQLREESNDHLLHIQRLERDRKAPRFHAATADSPCP